MKDRRRRRIAFGVVAGTAVIALVALAWFALPVRQAGHIAPLFAPDLEEPSWPPESPASLEAELETTNAARRIGASGILNEFDAGPIRSGDMPGLQVRSGVAQDLYYIETVIGEDASFDDVMPMAVLIHGRGDRARIPGGPFLDLGAPIRVIVPQAPDPLGAGFEWLPVRVGQNLVDRLTTSLLTRAAQLAAMLHELMLTLPTVGRALVIGFSQGGLLTFTLGTHYTDVVQAAFPLSAWLPPALVPPYRRDDITMPRIRGIHGSADRVIEPGPTSELYRTLSERGFDAELAIVEGGHEMTEEMNAQLHEWLQVEIGVVIERGIAAGVLDGGPPPCVPVGVWPDPPDGGWPEAGLPEAGFPEAGWPEASWPEAGWPREGWPPDARVPAGRLPPRWPFPWTPCPAAVDPLDAGVPDAGVPDAGVPQAAIAD